MDSIKRHIAVVLLDSAALALATGMVTVFILAVGR